MSYIIFAALGWCIDFLTTHGMPFLGPSEVMLNNSVRHQHPTCPSSQVQVLVLRHQHVGQSAQLKRPLAHSAAGVVISQRELEVDNLHDASVGGHRAQKIIQVLLFSHIALSAT